jgi:hypothetical protein
MRFGGMKKKKKEAKGGMGVTSTSGFAQVFPDPVHFD